MAIRKSMEETLQVCGERELWMKKIQAALLVGKFTRIEVNETLWQITANYKKLTVWGEMCVTLTSAAPQQTMIHLRVTSHVDNIYALFKSPNKRILAAFKAALSECERLGMKFD